MTLVEVLGVMAAVAILLALYLASLPKQWHHGSPGIQCVNNLKQIGLATRVWEGDNNDKYPTAVSVTNGGAMEFTTGPNAWKNYQVMSNELSTTKVLLCPVDRDRFLATNFTHLNNSNLSFFVGVDANETVTNAILSGDRNITNGMPLKNALLELTTNRLSGWNSELHGSRGNLVLADCSVRPNISSVGLQNAVANSGFATNRLQIPILAP
jgi:hypothetical protein